MAEAQGQEASPLRINAAIRKIFLSHLSETSNVAASARAAGVSSSAIYAERRRSAAFRDEWAAALAEGYARLETDLLAEAMQMASAKISDGMLKSRAQKHRLALALLAAHRVSVKGIGPISQPGTAAAVHLEMKAKLLGKINDMRGRNHQNNHNGSS